MHNAHAQRTMKDVALSFPKQCLRTGLRVVLHCVLVFLLSKVFLCKLRSLFNRFWTLGRRKKNVPAPSANHGRYDTFL
jgi:hypothetical protein